MHATRNTAGPSSQEGMSGFLFRSCALLQEEDSPANGLSAKGQLLDSSVRSFANQGTSSSSSSSSSATVSKPVLPGLPRASKTRQVSKARIQANLHVPVPAACVVDRPSGNFHGAACVMKWGGALGLSCSQNHGGKHLLFLDTLWPNLRSTAW
jgi:hypothetical protein